MRALLGVLFTIFFVVPATAQTDDAGSFLTTTPARVFTCVSVAKASDGMPLYKLNHYSRAYGPLLFLEPWLLFQSSYSVAVRQWEAYGTLESLSGDKHFENVYSFSGQHDLSSYKKIKSVVDVMPAYFGDIASVSLSNGSNFSYTYGGTNPHVKTLLTLTSPILGSVDFVCDVESAYTFFGGD